MYDKETRFLVVDDMAPMRTIITRMLEELGYKNVTQASDGRDALKVLEAKVRAGAAIQVVLSDWNMPGMSGIQLLYEVRSNATFKALPFMLITAERERDQVISAIKAGVTNYIVKPFSPAQLDLKLEEIWRKTHIQ
jgi:two-component system chemotaxis response regulator CheY